MAAPRYTLPHDFGLGGVAIGNEFQFATDEQAEATLAAAWDAGVRYFDVSPWYGLGLAERRFGQLPGAQAAKRVRDIVEGRQADARRPRQRGAEILPPRQFAEHPAFRLYRRRCAAVEIEDDLQRLGLDRLDVVFVHDLSPDNDYLPENWEALWPISREGSVSGTDAPARGRSDRRLGHGRELPAADPALSRSGRQRHPTCSPANIR
ncbi:aldo/keto reductase [Sphingomonas sp. MMS24-JH45]